MRESPCHPLVALRAPARVCPSRGCQAAPENTMAAFEHGLRWERRPGIRRPPVARRGAGGHPRRDARSHDECHRSGQRASVRNWLAWTPAFSFAEGLMRRFAVVELACRRSKRCCGRFPTPLRHYRNEDGDACAGARRGIAVVRRPAPSTGSVSVVLLARTRLIRAQAPGIATSASEIEARWTCIGRGAVAAQRAAAVCRSRCRSRRAGVGSRGAFPFAGAPRRCPRRRVGGRSPT